MATEYLQIGETRAIDLLLLTFAAGMIDALSYLRAHVFAANMTGNVVLLGLDLIRNEHYRGILFAVSLLAFAAGAILAGVALRVPGANRSREIAYCLTLELPFVLVFGGLCLIPSARDTPWITAGLIVTGASGLGVQSVAVRRLRISGVATTFITGTITATIMEFLGDDKGDGVTKGPPLLLLAMLITYLGAAATTAAFQATRVAPFVPLACVLVARLRWGPDSPTP